MAMEISFTPRWKEELVCTSSLGSLSLEMTMGGPYCVYFPTENTWKAKVPSWAENHWQEIYAQLQIWCQKNDAKLYVSDTAFIFPA